MYWEVRIAVKNKAGAKAVMEEATHRMDKSGMCWRYAYACVEDASGKVARVI